MKVIKSNSYTRDVGRSLRSVYHMPARVALHSTAGIILLPRKDILYCTAASNYTHIHTTDGQRYMVSKTLRQVESRLSGTDFFRIHQSCLVNVSAIDRLTKDTVRMQDSKILPLARSKRKELYEMLERITLAL